MAMDWQALLRGATQNGAPLFNAQGTTQGYNQWSAADPSMGNVDIVEIDGRKYASWGYSDGTYMQQLLDEAGNPVGEPQRIQAGSAGLKDWLKEAAPMAAMAGGVFAAPYLAGAMGMEGGALASSGTALGTATEPVSGLFGSAGSTALGTATEPVSSLVSKAGSGTGFLDGLFEAGGLAGKVLPIAGGLLAAVDANKDKTQSSEVAPWSAAQPWMRDNIAKGQALQAQYEANPFSPAEKTAYGNYAQLYNKVQQALPGLLAGYGANASGANNYDRTNPRRPLTGSNAFANAPKWSPGLLDFFPKG